MKKIYIAKTYKEEPISLILADNRDLADAFFQGSGEIPNSVEEIDVEKYSAEFQPKVLTLLTSKEKTVSSLGSGFDKVRIMKRGI